jgi:hypothetical protein
LSTTPVSRVLAAAAAAEAAATAAIRYAEATARIERSVNQALRDRLIGLERRVAALESAAQTSPE